MITTIDILLNCQKVLNFIKFLPKVSSFYNKNFKINDYMHYSEYFFRKFEIAAPFDCNNGGVRVRSKTPSLPI